MLRIPVMIVLCALIGSGLSCAPRDTAKVNWKEGREALISGKYREASALLSRTAEQLPKVAEVHYLQGCALLNLGELVRAEAAFRQGLAVKPGYAEALAGLGQIEYYREHYDEAGRLFRQALDAKADSPSTKASALNGLAGIAKIKGVNPLYRLYLIKGAAAAPEDACTFYNLGVMYRDTYKNAKRSVACFNNYLRLGDVNSAQRDKARSAIAYIEKKQLAEAQNKSRVKEDGKMLMEGTEAFAVRAYDRAVACFKKALKSKPDSFNAAWGLGKSLLRRGDKTGAFDAFKLAVKSNPGHVECCMQAVALAFQLKRHQDAERLLDAALAENEKASPVVKQLSMVFAAQGKKDIARAYGNFYLSLMTAAGASDNNFTEWLNSL